jgi:hypothetical protein
MLNKRNGRSCRPGCVRVVYVCLRAWWVCGAGRRGVWAAGLAYNYCRSGLVMDA